MLVFHGLVGFFLRLWEGVKGDSASQVAFFSVACAYFVVFTNRGFPKPQYVIPIALAIGFYFLLRKGLSRES
jgi:hypothetical protein